MKNCAQSAKISPYDRWLVGLHSDSFNLYTYKFSMNDFRNAYFKNYDNKLLDSLNSLSLRGISNRFSFILWPDVSATIENKQSVKNPYAYKVESKNDQDWGIEDTWHRFPSSGEITCKSFVQKVQIASGKCMSICKQQL